MSGKAKDGLIYEELTHGIIGAAMEVHRELKPGFAEKIYENALAIELGLRKTPLSSPEEYPGKL